MLGVISFALGLTVTKSSWPGDINLRVASLLDGLKDQVSGDRNQAGSEFWQFLRKDMMCLDKALVEGKVGMSERLLKKRTVTDRAQSIREKEASDMPLTCLL